jgi:hypothetical protein
MVLPLDTLDPMTQFQQFRLGLARRFGLQLPSGGEQVSGPALSGESQQDRVQQAAGRGTAPATLAGMGAAAGNAFGLMGGLGALTMGIGSMAERGLGLPGGTLGGIQNIPGYRAIAPEQRRLIHNLVDLEHAQAAAQHSGGNTAMSGGGKLGGGSIRGGYG